MTPRDSNPGAGEFPLTRLSLLRLMRDADAGARSEAEDVFWRAYQGPLYAYARHGRKSKAARDLVQGFCAWVIETDLLGRFEPAKGRLRSWMLLSFKGYIRDEEEREAAQKRGGGAVVEDIDEVEVVDPGPTPDSAYDLAWAKAIVARAFARWKAELAVDRKDVWKLALVQLIEVDGYSGLPSREDFARNHGVTLDQVDHFIDRDSKVYLKGELRREVRESCASDDDAREERDFLLQCLAAQ